VIFFTFPFRLFLQAHESVFGDEAMKMFLRAQRQFRDDLRCRERDKEQKCENEFKFAELLCRASQLRRRSSRKMWETQLIENSGLFWEVDKVIWDVDMRSV
jgi:hypothetical protein